MQITTERLEDHQLLLNVQVEEVVVEKSLDKAYRRLVNKTNIPGFRRGKAPRSMVERFIGRKALLEEALDQLLPELYRQAIEEQGIRALGEPRLEVVQIDPVIFKAVVPLPPTVELSDYRQIKVTPKATQVSQEEVDSFLEQVRLDTAPWEPSQGPARMGDLLTLDLRAEEGGNIVLEREALPLLMSPESKDPAPDLAEHLLGLEKGAQKAFRIFYPPDYQDEAWASRSLDFQVNVKEIKEKHPPALDDEFAKGVGEGFESLEALRQHIQSRLEERARREARERLEGEVVQAVVAGARAEFPPVLAQREVEVLLSDLKGQVERQGISFPQYLKFAKKGEEELREELLPRAKERVKRRLVLEKVAEAEGIAVTPEEVAKEIEEAVREAGPRGNELRAALEAPAGRSSVEGVLRIRKAVARLVELATAEEPEPLAATEEVASQGEGG